MAGQEDEPREHGGPERRRAPRDEDDRLDWESRALLRVANRVQSFEISELGWEERPIRRLREHLCGGRRQGSG
jgi:hypothetical protein